MYRNFFFLIKGYLRNWIIQWNSSFKSS